MRVLVVMATLLTVFPGSGQARSPLTDSTDVSVPAPGVDVENSIAASPLNPNVLLLSNRLPTGSTTWISLNAGKTWGYNQTLEANSFSPASAIGRLGGGPSNHGRFYVNYNVGPGVLRPVNLAIKQEAASSWNPP